MSLRTASIAVFKATLLVLGLAAGYALGGVILGLGFGAIAAFGLNWISTRNLAETTSILTISLALAITLLAVGRLIRIDSTLAVFVARVVLGSSISSREEIEQKNVHEATGRFLLFNGWFGPIGVFALF